MTTDYAPPSEWEDASGNQDEAGEFDEETFERGFVNATQVTSNYLGKLDKAVNIDLIAFRFSLTDRPDCLLST